MIRLIFFLSTFLVIIIFPLLLTGQEIEAGYYTYEAQSVSTKEHHYLMLREFIRPSAEEEKEIRETGMITYLDLSPGAFAFGMSDSYRSLLFSLDNEGDIEWVKSIGRGMTSAAPAVAVDRQGMIYTGDNDSTTDAGVRLFKLNADGEEIWSVYVDSLDDVHDIVVDEKKTFLTALVSFTNHFPVYDTVGEDITMHFDRVNFYFTLTIDKESGEVISKTYCPILTGACSVEYWMSGMGDHSTAFIFNKDTLLKVYLDTTIALQELKTELAGSSIVSTQQSSWFHAALCWNKTTGKWRIVYDRYDDKAVPIKQTNIDIPVAHRPASPPHFLMNELNGFTLLIPEQDSLYIVKYDGSLDLVWRRSFPSRRDGPYTFISFDMAPGGDYEFFYIKTEGYMRYLHRDVLSRTGTTH